MNDHYKQLLCESVASYLAKRHALNNKEQRLLAYMLNDNNSAIIGDICKSLKTTTLTLLTKTRPELFRKIGNIGSEAWEKNIQEALDSGSMPQFVTSRNIHFYQGKGTDYGGKEE
ncbi:hypothetical protein [Fontibacillus sp. BL9]|uniref:hypothetical protein n=1 Tax=Fontibacillus sp. BL9 TaxID=3389971 RepID=UPI00397A3B75